VLSEAEVAEVNRSLRLRSANNLFGIANGYKLSQKSPTSRDERQQGWPKAERHIAIIERMRGQPAKINSA
jgi:hypothetical protein